MLPLLLFVAAGLLLASLWARGPSLPRDAGPTPARGAVQGPVAGAACWPHPQLPAHI